MHGGEFTKMIRTDVETSIWHECDGLYMRCSEWHADTKKTCRERQTVKQRRVILHRKEQVNRRLTLANTVRFLPRGADYAVARCLYASVCLSVCPSVRHIGLGYWYSVEKVKHILKLLSPSGSHTHTILFLVFENQTVWQHSDGDPPTGTSNARGMKKSRFSTYSRFISEMIQDRNIVRPTMEGE